MRLAPQPEQPGRFQQPGPRSGLAAYCAWANIHRGRGVAVVPDVERSLDIEFLLEHPADDVRPPWYEGTRVAEMYKPASGTWRGTTLSAPICVEEPSEGGPVERCLGTVNIAHQEAGRFGDDASYAWARACGEVIGGLYSARRARLLALKSWRGWHDSALPGLEALPAGEKERARVFANGPELLRLRGSTDKRVVAAKVGIDPKSLGGYERGNPALLSKLESLAQYYKVDVEKLIKS